VWCGDVSASKLWHVPRGAFLLARDQAGAGHGLVVAGLGWDWDGRTPGRRKTLRAAWRRWERGETARGTRGKLGLVSPASAYIWSVSPRVHLIRKMGERLFHLKFQEENGFMSIFR